MTFALTYSAAELYALSQQIGAATAALQMGPPPSGLSQVSDALTPLARSEFLSGLEAARFQRILHHADRHFSAASTAWLLSRVEGRLLGALVHSKTLPEEARALFADRLAGRASVTAEEIIEANRRVRAPWINSFLRRSGGQPIGYPRHVRRTRLMPFPALSEILGRMVFLKMESLQSVGSFKNRGATNFLVNALLAGKNPREIRIGTASRGNHAQGVVRAAHNLGIRKVEVLLPRNASPLKIAQLKSLGAQVELFGDTFEEAEDEVRRRAKAQDNYLFLPAFDHPSVVSGQGTVGFEISQQMAVQGIDRYAVVCPEDGGLLAGVTTYLQPLGISVFGVASTAHLLYGALPLLRRGVPENLPIVCVLSDKGADKGLLEEIKDRDHGQSWVQRFFKFEEMTSVLQAAGYLQNGVVRTLRDFEDAKGFIDGLVAHLPAGWDPIDALARLHFGPWLPEGEKDINASLRSLGGYQERWGGDKALSLIHPLGDRAARMVAGMALVRSGKKTLPDVVKNLGLLNVQPRLMTETYLVDVYLNRKDFLRRLWPEVSDTEIAYRMDRLKEDNRLIKTSLAAFGALIAQGEGKRAQS